MNGLRALFLVELAAERGALVQLALGADLGPFLAAFFATGDFTTLAAKYLAGHVGLLELAAKRCSLVEATGFTDGPVLGTTGVGSLVLSTVTTEINLGDLRRVVHASCIRIGVIGRIVFLFTTTSHEQ